MEAATLKTVTSNLHQGVDARPAANVTAGAGPAPVAAPNSGRKLDSSLLTASSSVTTANGSK